MKDSNNPFRRFSEAVRNIRKRPLDRTLIDKFNRVIEKNREQNKQPKEELKPSRKIARPPEADV